MDSYDNSREKRLRERFDPDNISEWLQYTPESFMVTIIHEIRREKEIIRAWAELLNDDPNLKAVHLTRSARERRIDATYGTSTILEAYWRHTKQDSPTREEHL